MLSNSLKENQTNYILSSGDQASSPVGLLYYLSCLPDVKELSKSIQSGANGMGLYEIKDQWIDHLAGCPTVTDPVTLHYLMKDASSKSGYQDEYQVLKMLGDEVVLYSDSNKDLLDTYLWMAQIYLDHQDELRAWSTYHMAASINLDKTLVSIKKSAGQHPNNVVLKTLLVNYSEAGLSVSQVKSRYEELIKNNPDSAILHYSYGEYLLAQSDVTGSHAQFTKAAALSPQVKRYREALGESYARIKAFDKSLEVMQDLLNQYPHSGSLMIEKLQVEASYYAAEGNTPLAVRLYNSISEDKDPNQTEKGDVIAYSFLSGIKPAADLPANAKVRRDVFVGTISKEVLFMASPASQSFILTIPPYALLKFSPALSPEVWHIGMGDGVTFKITLEGPDGKKELYSKYIDPEEFSFLPSVDG